MLLLALACHPIARAAEPPAPQRPSFKSCAVCPEMVVLPAGRFTMGSPPTEPGRKDDESPAVPVQVHAFAMGRFDITRAQWAAFVADTGRPDELGCAYSGLDKSESGNASWRHLGFEQGDDHPVVCVSWNEVHDYLRWLSAKAGRTYRLPTEAEWEYAARAGTTTTYPWGDEPSHEWANYGAETCCTGLASGRDRWVNTSPVGSFPPNAWGLYDMIGNVWQWVEDCYVPSLAGRPADASAVDSAACSFRVARGGTWGDHPALIRAAARNYAPPPSRPVPNYRSAGFGFRVAADLTGQEEVR
jgi:formylglycine-generating enzyme required for sulfatase activity